MSETGKGLGKGKGKVRAGRIQLLRRQKAVNIIDYLPILVH